MSAMFRVLGIIVVVACVSTFAKKRTLVLVDNWSTRESHSIFFKDLRGKIFYVLYLCVFY